MTKIYIDTNVYLDFYQASTDRLEVFKEIERHGKNIVIVTQTISEFLRNRVQRLELLAQHVEKSTSGGIYTTTIIRELQQFDEIVTRQKEIKKLSATMVETLHKWRDHADSDPLFSAIHKITESALTITPTDQAFKLAKRRKLVGDPPTSPDKQTIGDELIWEALLESIKEDLIIVTRDRTFSLNVALLAAEFETATTKKLKVTPQLSEALTLIGEASPLVAEAEKELSKLDDMDARTLGYVCPNCGGTLEDFSVVTNNETSTFKVRQCSKCSSRFIPATIPGSVNSQEK